VSANHYSWSNPRVLLTFALIFLCGALVGAIAITLTAQSQAYTASTPQELNRQLTLSRLTTELDLTESQQERLRVVLDDYFQYYHALQDQLDEVKASGRDKITEILTDEQKAKFQQMLNRAQSEVH
jgi:Spy/CpxP family protein refolding chaperone